jgi:hypothetical protein
MSAAETEIDEPVESRALVVVGSAQPHQPASLPRRAAPFLAQLIATRTQAPQTRANRRAEPAEAIARYRAVAGMLRKAQ